MIKDDIQNQIHKSLKEGDKQRVDALRFVLSQIKYKEINSLKEITDDETINVLQQEVKKRTGEENLWVAVTSRPNPRLKSALFFYINCLVLKLAGNTFRHFLEQLSEIH